MRNSVFLLLTAVLLVGCKATITPTVYVRDMEDPTVLTTPAVLAVRSPGINKGDSCKQLNEKMNAVLSAYFENVKLAQCDGGNIARFQVDVPVFRISRGEKLNVKPKAVNVLLVESGGEIAVKILTAQHKVQEILAAIKKRTFLTVDLEDIRVAVNLDNDTRENVKLRTRGTIANTTNCHETCRLDLAPRGTVTATASDVVTLWLMTAQPDTRRNAVKQFTMITVKR